MIGKWIFIDEGEFYCMGRVKKAVTADYLLVEIEPNSGPRYSHLYLIDELAGDNVLIFDSFEKLEEWRRFMKKEVDKKVPLSPKIVSINQHPKGTGE